jgi:hypothetical protein
MIDANEMMHKEIHVRVQVPGQGRLQELVMLIYSKEIRARVHLCGRGRLQQLAMVVYPSCGSVIFSLFNAGLLITK